VLLALAADLRAGAASFETFDQRAKAGERLNVVFFGASLTYGANASDPNLTSCRALIGDRLTAKYPQARFKFWDGAIGGTGSQLGVFRLERECLRRNPDLVFLDFSANDDIYSDNRETLASYEAILRRIVAKDVPVVQVIFPFLWNTKAGNTGGMKRRDAHLQLAAAYNTVAGDAIELSQRRVKAGETTVERLWPVDGVHPCDDGYVLFADAAWTAFEQAVAEKRVCKAPEKMLFGDAYMTSARYRLSALPELPQGWRKARPSLTSAAFDMLMSRWLDDVVVAGSSKKAEPAPAPLKVRFKGSMVMLFGESTPASCPYRVKIDGAIVERQLKEGKTQEFDAGHLGKLMNGNSHHVQVLAEGLDANVEHTLEIEPLFAKDKPQEIRIESVCVAGGEARVGP
jgi:lysophospholipase L1-like esterase